jgi:hypothetical protein
MAAKLIARKLTGPAYRLALLITRQSLGMAIVWIALKQTGHGGSNKYPIEERPSHDFSTISELAPEGSRSILQSKTLNV